MVKFRNCIFLTVIFALLMSSFVFADGENNVNSNFFDSIERTENVTVANDIPSSEEPVKKEPKYIGVFRMTDPFGNLMDFSASKVFYLDKNGVLQYNDNFLNIWIKNIENHYNALYPSYTSVSIGANNRASLVKVGGNRKINKNEFLKHMKDRIEKVNYDLFFIPFLPDKNVNYNPDNRVVLLGSFSTKYNAGNVGRTENIVMSGQYINGYVLKPGQVYSQNSTLKPLESKYKTAKVIMGDEFVDGKGGGLCQVSTTMFNSALLSGLEIVERNNHSLRIGYVPGGRDAMVASGYSDFKFRNNLSHNVYIFYRRPAANIIQFDIYGHPSDKKSVSLSTSNSDAYNFTLTRKINGKPDSKVYRSTYQKPKDN